LSFSALGLCPDAWANGLNSQNSARVKEDYEEIYTALAARYAQARTELYGNPPVLGALINCEIARAWMRTNTDYPWRSVIEDGAEKLKICFGGYL